MATISFNFDASLNIAMQIMHTCIHHFKLLKCSHACISSVCLLVYIYETCHRYMHSERCKLLAA